MNLSFNFCNYRKLIILVCITLISSFAKSITLSGIYTGSCERQLGLILNVNSSTLFFLSINGQLVKIPRYQVVQIASYPVDSMRTQAEVQVADVPLFQVSTIVNREEKVLATGFPLNFTNDKVSFLNLMGQEVVVDKFNIFSIRHLQNLPTVEIRGRSEKKYEYVHPQSFRDCQNDHSDSQVYPVQILSDPITIKRELDRLEVGHQRLQFYIEEQTFYPKPLIYQNQTSLGLWQSFGSRFGSSSGRSNNATPYLKSEKASDIYSYQRVFITGSGPNEFFDHEEAQTQAAFSFKASYFQFHMMADPSLLMVGKTYTWQKDDLNSKDSRLVQTSYMSMNYDHENMSFGFLSSSLYLATRLDSEFSKDTVQVPKFYFQWTGFQNRIQFIHGQSQFSSFAGVNKSLKYGSTRLNWHKQWNERFLTMASLILRNLEQKSDAAAFRDQQKSISILSAWTLNKKYRIEGLLSFESQKFENIYSAESQSGNDTIHPKLAAAFHLFF